MVAEEGIGTECLSTAFAASVASPAAAPCSRLVFAASSMLADSGATGPFTTNIVIAAENLGRKFSIGKFLLAPALQRRRGSKYQLRMSRLNFSFNKPKPAVKPPISTSTLAFDNDEDEDSLLTKPEKTKKEHGAIAGLNQDLRGYTSFAEEAAARMTKEALDVDPSGIVVS